MAKKIAGKERPYDYYEFKCIVEKFAREASVPCIDELDYFDSCKDYDATEDKVIDRDDYEIFSQTRYGSSEGIYSDFYLSYGDTKKRVMVAKNLSRDDVTFVKMHIFAAQIVLIAKMYIENNKDEFNWRGFDVSYLKDDGKTIPYMWCGKIENTNKYVQELLTKHDDVEKVFVRDNATRKVTEYPKNKHS